MKIVNRVRNALSKLLAVEIPEGEGDVHEKSDGIRKKKRSTATSIIGANYDWVIESSDMVTLLKSGRQVFNTIEIESAAFGIMALSVWHSLTQTDLEDFDMFFQEQEQWNCYSAKLVFTDDHLRSFTAWYAEYTKRFNFDRGQTLLPEPQPGETLSGTFVEHRGSYFKRMDGYHAEKLYGAVPDDNVFDQWLWIIQNTSGRVLATHSHWIFEDQSEAVLFDLNFRDMFTQMDQDAESA